ncbi:HAD family hydrolase [Loigolactobacillus backii]|uniref:TIGR01457 family HAD-type hydrolase n=1 Tax=Loigolactobacillus backii TaxID=375175 RepID=UPI000C1CBB89|nr:TIGR01457 family HAD-type hydrolase [Loigolactobacillus backii]PIO83169.1 HAD family hydrolase [Loigolactobacillus backii]
MQKKYKAYFIDLDGTLYRGKEKIPAASRFIARLQAQNISFLVLTNNTTQTPEVVAANLTKNYDMQIKPENVFTAGLATAAYIRSLNLGNRVYAIGELGLKQAILNQGFQFDDLNPDYVVVGLDWDVTYRKFEKATLAIQKGAKFIGTNADTNLPNERGLVPGAGSVIALVERSTQQKATYVGKPQPIMLEAALKQFGLRKEEAVMVGDNYNTDILAGINTGVDTLLVYTGYSKPADIEKVIVKPTHEIQSLDEWDV